MKWITAVLVLAVSGCGGDARMELASSDALTTLANQFQQGVEEYHGNIAAGDSNREAAVTAAFVERIVTDKDGDKAVLQQHAAAFTQALSKIRSDRDVESARYAAMKDNVAVLRELSKTISKVAVDTLTLNDEMRRYLSGWVDTYQRARTTAANADAAAKAQQAQARDAMINAGVGAVGKALAPGGK